MEEKRLNSKSDFINEKKTVNGVTKLPPSGTQELSNNIRPIRWLF